MSFKEIISNCDFSCEKAKKELFDLYIDKIASYYGVSGFQIGLDDVNFAIFKGEPIARVKFSVCKSERKPIKTREHLLTFLSVETDNGINRDLSDRWQKAQQEFWGFETFEKAKADYLEQLDKLAETESTNSVEQN